MSTSESTSATGSPYELSRTSSQTSFDTHEEEVPAPMQITNVSPVQKIVFVGAGYVGMLMQYVSNSA